MRETWNCMANLLANVVSVSLAAAPRGIRQTRGKTAEPAYQRHRALLRPHAYRPRRGRATERGTRDVSIDRIAFGPPPARAGLQVTQISRVNSGWRNDFATLSAACTQPAYGATKHDGRFLAAPYPIVMTPMRRVRLAVDRSEKIAGLIPLALIAPEPRHAHRRAQFPGLCLLRPRNRERTLEIRLRIRRTRPLRQHRDFAGYAMDIGLVPPFLDRKSVV